MYRKPELDFGEDDLLQATNKLCCDVLVLKGEI